MEQCIHAPPQYTSCRTWSAPVGLGSLGKWQEAMNGQAPVRRDAVRSISIPLQPLSAVTRFRYTITLGRSGLIRVTIS